MDKLKQLISRCKCSVSLSINEHREIYETAEQALEEAKQFSCPPDIDDDVRKIMIETDTVIILRFYPDNPVGFYEIYHYDLDKCFDIAAPSDVLSLTGSEPE